ncbi:MAG: hypothetical protein OQJ98_02315 [Candidatus Pacebacteria bacterium]|nr:hypothetical protein [Candidatus Paceibacterota bacterium]
MNDQNSMQGGIGETKPFQQVILDMLDPKNKNEYAVSTAQGLFLARAAFAALTTHVFATEISGTEDLEKILAYQRMAAENLQITSETLDAVLDIIEFRSKSNEINLSLHPAHQTLVKILMTLGTKECLVSATAPIVVMGDDAKKGVFNTLCDLVTKMDIPGYAQQSLLDALNENGWRLGFNLDNTHLVSATDSLKRRMGINTEDTASADFDVVSRQPDADNIAAQ